MSRIQGNNNSHFAIQNMCRRWPHQRGLPLRNSRVLLRLNLLCWWCTYITTIHYDQHHEQKIIISAIHCDSFFFIYILYFFFYLYIYTTLYPAPVLFTAFCRVIICNESRRIVLLFFMLLSGRLFFTPIILSIYIYFQGKIEIKISSIYIQGVKVFGAAPR